MLFFSWERMNEMTQIIATAESVEQAEKLLEAGVDQLYIGNDDFGLRLPNSFSNEAIETMTKMAHTYDKTVLIAVNGLMHNEHIESITPYLQFLEQINVDAITLGDPGVVQTMRKEQINIPFVYDAQTLVTSARQVNFWVKRGAVGAILARELTWTELQQIKEQVEVPLELLVYGATCIHQSKRPLVENYFNFIDENTNTTKDRGLFLAEPKRTDTHYSIYEDKNGTHIFANDDVNLLPYVDDLFNIGLTNWKLDGIFTKGDRFVEIAKLFVQAKEALIAGTLTTDLKLALNEQLMNLHPVERTLSEGFYSKDPSEVQ